MLIIKTLNPFAHCARIPTWCRAECSRMMRGVASLSSQPTGRGDAHAGQLRSPCSQGGACHRRLERRCAPAAQTRALRTGRALAAVRGPRQTRLAGPPRPRHTPAPDVWPPVNSPRRCLKLLLSMQAGRGTVACLLQACHSLQWKLNNTRGARDLRGNTSRVGRSAGAGAPRAFRPSSWRSRAAQRLRGPGGAKTAGGPAAMDGGAAAPIVSGAPAAHSAKPLAAGPEECPHGHPCNAGTTSTRRKEVAEYIVRQN